jgi:DNA polymerase
MLIGQNPGQEEDQQGRPFVGRSGKYLDIVIRKSGLKREALFITSVVKCRTVRNRKPTKAEIQSCLPLLVEQIKQIRPRLIVLMGNVAWQTPRLDGVRYIETYHPAAAMRFPRIREKFEQDFKHIKDAL